jgi:hypothetical protein
MSKIVRLTESDLNRIVRRIIKEDFEDEWPDKDRYENFPEHLWDKYEDEGGLEKMMLDPEWQEWKKSSDEISKYHEEKKKSFEKLEPSPEVKQCQDILSMEPWEKKNYKTKKQIIKYIENKQNSIDKVKQIIGI